MDKMCIRVKGNADVTTVYIGNRKVDMIEGLKIKKYIPDAILNNVDLAMEDWNLKWEDEVICDCQMILGDGKYITMMYKYEPFKFNGLMLFTFNVNPKYEHRFGFPLKGEHLEFVLKYYNYLI